MFYNAKNDVLEYENTTVDYISFGEGKEDLIFIPGLGEGLNSINGFAVPFSLMYKIYAKDYRVHVFSRRKEMPEDFSTEDMANDIIKHMEELNIEKAHIVGVSQGGMIAEHIAINAPEKVNKLVLVVTVARKNKILEETVKNWIELGKVQDYKAIMIDTAEKSYTGDYLEKNRKLYKVFGMLEKNATFDRFLIEAKACLTHNAYSKLNKITAPTLIIGARKDLALGIEGSEELANKINGSELYIYEEYSHGVYEQAKDFNKRVIAYLKK